MKTNIFTLVLLVSVGLLQAQAYKGKGDIKGQIGLNTQSHGTGITASADFGIGENMSYGFTATYLLSADNINDAKPRFEDRADIKARFNANLGNVFQLDKKMDIYPGLDLSARNFGAHLGFRYFFTEGFGLFAEAGAPLARYDSDVYEFEYYNNQFVLNIGCSFNL
jgi:outer membrane protein G